MMDQQELLKDSSEGAGVSRCNKLESVQATPGAQVKSRRTHDPCHGDEVPLITSVH